MFESKKIVGIKKQGKQEKIELLKERLSTYRSKVNFSKCV